MYAGEGGFFQSAPLAYSSVFVDEPKPSYEYSTSVQTPSYNNYAHVRSGGELERKIYNFAAPIAAPLLSAEPIIAEAKFLRPVSIFWFVIRRFVSFITNLALQALAQPIFKATPLSSEFRTIAATPAAYAIPSTKLLPIAYEAKPFYRFAAPASTIVAGKFTKSFLLFHFLFSQFSLQIFFIQ